MTEPYYADEGVTLYLGDCREITEWLDADVLVTDPPYGISHRSGWARALTVTYAGYKRPINGDADVTLRDEALTLWGPRPALVFGSWKQPHPAGTRAILIWDKGGAAGMGDLAIPWKPSWEQVYVLGRGFSGTRDNGVIRARIASRISMGRNHQMEKPLALMQALIVKTTGTVADPFAGSGSTLVAAKALGREAIGVEVDERHAEITARRLAQGVLTW